MTYIEQVINASMNFPIYWFVGHAFKETSTRYLISITDYFEKTFTMTSKLAGSY